MMHDFIRQLRLLPYADMMIVAAELAKLLPKQYDVGVVANALGQVSKMKLEDSVDTTTEAKLMREIFSRRRSLSIKYDHGGYQLQIETLNASILHTDIKIGIEHLLDTVVTAHALRK